MRSRILIADDSDIARSSLRELLESHAQWEVCAEVKNGQEAVSKAVELKPDVIILDLAMPVMDGIRAAREITRILPGVPIVIYTLHEAPWIELEAKKAGARHVISKPDANGLLNAIENVLKPPVVEPMAAAAAATLVGGTGPSRSQPQQTELSATEPDGPNPTMKAD